MSNNIGTISQIKGYLGESEVKATYFQNIPTYIKAPIIDTSTTTKIKAKGVYELGGRLELYDTSTSPLVSRVDITGSDWCDLTPNPGNLNKGINLFTVQQAIVYNNVEYKSEITDLSRTVYEIQRVQCSGGTVTWSRQDGGTYLNTIKAFAGELVYWKVTPDSTHRIPSGYSDRGSVELLSSNFDINAAGNATYIGSAICTQCEQIKFTITLTKSGTGADDASWTNSSGSINSVEAVKGDTIGTMSNNTIIIYIGETSTPRHTLTFSITESEGYSYSTTYTIPSVASIQEPLTFSAAVTKTIKQYTMTFSKIGTDFNWNNNSSLLVDHGTLCSFIGGTARFGEVTRTLSGSKTGYDPIFSITRNPSTDRLWTANSNLSLIGNVTWQPQDCDINIKINTGISKIYYKVNGASVYSYVNTDSTITAKYDSEVKWYAVCEEGYEGTGLGSAANPNSFTMGLEAQIRPTAMRKEYTVTFTRSGESTGTGWSKSTATAQHGDNFYRAEDSNVVKIKQWDDNTQFRDESTFNYGTKTGYNLSVNYTFTNPITYNTSVNAEVVATPIPYLIRFSKGTGISSIKYRTSSSAAFVEAPNSTFIDYNTTIQWYADVSSGYTGNNTGSSSSPNSVTVTGATTISATATVNKYSLTLTKNSNVASLSYRVGSSGNYTTVTSTTTVANIDFNSALYLYATAATGYSVPNTVSNPVETTMPVNGYTYSPTATINKHSLILTIGSKVSSISYKIGTSGTYTTVSSNTTVPNVNYNSQIQLYATPVTGYSVPNSSTNPLTINLPDADYTYQPTATPKNYTLTLTKNANVASLSYKVNGATTYTTVSATTTINNIPYDSWMYLYATPNTGYSVPNSSAANYLQVKMGEGYNYSPVATAKTYLVTGTCTNGSVKWSDSASGSYSLGIETTYGSTIYWKVTASSGYEAPSPASGSVVLNDNDFTLTEQGAATYNTTFVCTAKTYTIRQYSPNGGSLYWGTSSIASGGGTATLSREFGKKVYWRIDADRGYDRPSTYYGDLTFNTTNFNLSGSNADLKSGIVDDCVGKTEYTLQVERLNSGYYTHSVSVGGVSLDSGGTVYQGERVSCSATAKASSVSPSSLSVPTFTVNSPSKITVYNSNSISVTCYYSTTSGGTTSNVTIPASGSKQITGLTANTTYYFFFRGNATQTDYQVKINNGEYGNTASTTVLIAGNTTVTFNGKANTSTVSMDSSVASAKTQTKSYATITFGLTGSYASEYTGTLTLTENGVTKKTMQVTNGVIDSNTYSATVNEEYKLKTETVTIGSHIYSADTVTLTPTSTQAQTMNASIVRTTKPQCPNELCLKEAGQHN